MIKGIYADIIVSVYLLFTLYLRFTLEKQLAEHPIISIALGVVLLLFIWALIKTKILQPDYFGLLKPKQNNSIQPK